MRSVRTVVRAPHHGGLVEATGGGVHAEIEARIRRPEDVLAVAEAAENGRAGGKARGQMMRGPFEARLLLVTGEAGGVARGVVRTHRLGVMTGHEQGGSDRTGGEQRKHHHHQAQPGRAQGESSDVHLPAITSAICSTAR